MKTTAIELPLKENLSAAKIHSLANRLYSLDALRGFDMFWIMGAEELFHTMAKATNAPFWKVISNQFTHPAWNGFHFYDLIFPLFLVYRRCCNTVFCRKRIAKRKNKKPGAMAG